jgi:hypothetical protein
MILPTLVILLAWSRAAFSLMSRDFSMNLGFLGGFPGLDPFSMFLAGHFSMKLGFSTEVLRFPRIFNL